VVNGWVDTVEKLIGENKICAAHLLPILPRLRTHVLRLFLSKATERTFTDDVLDAIASAVCLVQWGLDTHELVTDEEPLESRQQKVLAGDYTSAQYYALLAACDQREAIACVADAICAINRKKVQGYLWMQHEPLVFSQQLSIHVACDTLLYLCFSHWISERHRACFEQVIVALATCGRLSRYVEDGVVACADVREPMRASVHTLEEWLGQQGGEVYAEPLRHICSFLLDDEVVTCVLHSA
jgi:hypothetical protein